MCFSVERVASKLSRKNSEIKTFLINSFRTSLDSRGRTKNLASSKLVSEDQSVLQNIHQKPTASCHLYLVCPLSDFFLNVKFYILAQWRNMDKRLK